MFPITSTTEVRTEKQCVSVAIPIEFLAAKAHEYPIRWGGVLKVSQQKKLNDCGVHPMADVISIARDHVDNFKDFMAKAQTVAVDDLRVVGTDVRFVFGFVV